MERRLAQLKAENQRLRRAVEELSVLNEVASAVASALSLNTIVDLIVEKCVKHLKVEQGAVLLFEQRQEAASLRTMVRKVQSDLSSIPYRLGDQITGWMLKNQASLVINDLASDTRFTLPPEARQEIGSLMCVPLRLKGRLIGVLNVFNKRSREGFTEADLRLLTIIASQSAQVIENARLYQEEQALRLMQQEMQVAREIQTKLLPKTAPEIPGYDIAGKTLPARNVGGDYFDFLRSGEGRLAICLADVSGKGIPAALLMANVQATIRSQALLGVPAAECLRGANELLYESTNADKFVTLFYGLLDTACGELRYSNGGHNPPMLFSADCPPQELTAGGLVLGVLPGVPYEEGTLMMKPGDLLLIFSDGFTEATNRHSEYFGEKRIEEIAARHRSKPAAVLVEEIFRAVSAYTGDAPQGDDMTLVAVRATG